VKPLAAAYPATELRNPLTTGAILQAIGTGAARSLAVAWAYVSKHREARAAGELYARLSRLSDGELARRGLKRERLAELTKHSFR
jgi:hypothetical protein